MLSNAHTTLSEVPFVDDKPNPDIAGNGHQSAWHRLSTTFRIRANRHRPILLPQAAYIAIVIELDLRWRRRIRYTQCPVPEARYRDGPAIPVPKVELSVIKFGDDAICVRERDLAAITVHEHGANADRTADSRSVNRPILTPPELAIESIITCLNTYPPGEFPIIDLDQNGFPGIPSMEIRQFHTTGGRTAGNKGVRKEADSCLLYTSDAADE